MSLRKRKWKSIKATSISHAIELCLDYATENHRRPAKVLADLMGIDVKLLYRWMSDSSMPLNRIRQFETFCGASYISEYLCTAHGDKIVIDIPSGKNPMLLIWLKCKPILQKQSLYWPGFTRMVTMLKDSFCFDQNAL
jgi:hypothetical protein